MADSVRNHETVLIERLLPNCPAHVWSAWASFAKKKAWFGEGLEESHFEPGGIERSSFITDMGVHDNETRYFEIKEGERIVFAYSMALNGRIHSVSLATVTFANHQGGTRLTYREHLYVIPPGDGAEGRKAGWSDLLDSLADYLAGDAPTTAAAAAAALPDA